MTEKGDQPIRRMKTYTGQTGFVYQYYFVGKRPALADDPDAPAVEYIFDVTADRKRVFAVSVFFTPAAAEAWGVAHSRALTDSEQYAAAKLRLLRAFDEIENLFGQGRRLRVDAENVCELLQDLDLG